MKKTLAIFLCAAALPFTSFTASSVVRPAPDFSFQGLGGRLSHVRGQPVVLVIARSPGDKHFRKEAKLLRQIYHDFAARQVLFIAAFQNEADAKLPSDIPWIVADNGPKIASDYGFGDFGIVVIGKDGNVDLRTDKITPGERVRAVLVSSFAVQAAERK